MASTSIGIVDDHAITRKSLREFLAGAAPQCRLILCLRHAWRQWAAHHGVPEAHTLSGPRLAQYSALIQAAASGLGIGLVPQVLVLDELAQGTLVVPCGDTVFVDQGHYLCFNADRLELPVFAAFRDWVLDQGRRSLKA